MQTKHFFKFTLTSYFQKFLQNLWRWSQSDYKGKKKFEFPVPCTLQEGEQFSVGVVPITEAAGKGLKGIQSSMAIFPIAVANCAEKR